MMNFCTACQKPYDEETPCDCDAAGLQPVPAFTQWFEDQEDIDFKDSRRINND
jgi:hypothetical protein